MNCFQILGDVLTHVPVSSGGAADKPSVHILQSDRQAIDFGFHRKLGGSLAFQNPVQKSVQFVHAEHILQAHQRHRVCYLLKLTQCFSPHPLGGRIRRCQFGIGFFQILQFPEQTVIFKVRHRGIIQYVVLVICLREKAGQFFYSIFWIHNFLRSVKKCSERLRQSLSPRQRLHCSL